MGHLDSAFWHEDFGFVIDRTHIPVSSAGTQLTAFREDKFADLLESAGRLPSLNGAPVTSWLLPRLVEVTRDGINLDDDEHVRNDGGCVFLQWVSFTKQMNPRAFFHLLCYSNRIVIEGKCMPNTAPADLTSAFVSPLLEQPKRLRKWKAFATDTDPPTAPGKLGRTYVFGWDGAKFLGTRDYE